MNIFRRKRASLRVQSGPQARKWAHVDNLIGGSRRLGTPRTPPLTAWFQQAPSSPSSGLASAAPGLLLWLSCCQLSGYTCPSDILWHLPKLPCHSGSSPSQMNPLLPSSTQCLAPLLLKLSKEDLPVHNNPHSLSCVVVYIFLKTSAQAWGLCGRYLPDHRGRG